MATVLEDLQESKENLVTRLKEVTAKPKPSYSIDGQSVSWESYTQMLTAQIKALNELIAIEGGPTELVSNGIS